MDGLWYCFDDSDVQQLSEDEVCTQTAYILFYQRRTAIPSWSANSSVAGNLVLGCFFTEQEVVIHGPKDVSESFIIESLTRLIFIIPFNLGSDIISVKEVWVDSELPWTSSRSEFT